MFYINKKSNSYMLVGKSTENCHSALPFALCSVERYSVSQHTALVYCYGFAVITLIKPVWFRRKSFGKPTVNYLCNVCSTSNNQETQSATSWVTQWSFPEGVGHQTKLKWEGILSLFPFDEQKYKPSNEYQCWFSISVLWWWRYNVSVLIFRVSSTASKWSKYIS